MLGDFFLGWTFGPSWSPLIIELLRKGHAFPAKDVRLLGWNPDLLVATFATSWRTNKENAEWRVGVRILISSLKPVDPTVSKGDSPWGFP